MNSDGRSSVINSTVFVRNAGKCAEWSVACRWGEVDDRIESGIDSHFDHLATRHALKRLFNLIQPDGIGDQVPVLIAPEVNNSKARKASSGVPPCVPNNVSSP